MSGKLHQLLYRSYSAFDFDPKELVEILEKSHKNNPEKNITGILLYKSGVFLQIIEGVKEDLEALYKKISKDPRHEDLKILWQQDIEERSFADWSMAFKDLSEAPQEVLDGFGETLNKVLEQDQLGTNEGLDLFLNVKATL